MVGTKKILVTGSNGQLGRSICDISKGFEYKFFFMTKKELDITNLKDLESFVSKNQINVIINCAAYTNVEKAQINRDIVDLVNIKSMNNISKVCGDNEITLIHISTDYVFDGKNNRPYRENDFTNPLNYYGYSKLCGEKEILKSKLKNSIIIRTSWLYSKYKDNFFFKILKKLKNNNNIIIVKDEVGSPTYASDLAVAILQIVSKISNSKTEIFHFSNTGFCSRHELASKINNLIEGESLVIPSINSETKIKRPKFSALDSSKIMKSFDLDISSWEESLTAHLNNIGLKEKNNYEV